MRMPLRVLPLAAALALLAGCVDFADFGDFDAYKEDFHSTHPLNAGGTVSVETFNGSIEVIGWEQNSVEVNGTKYASNKSALDALKIDISSSPGSVRIRAVRPAGSHWRLGARFSIRVPRKAHLDRISSSNGKIGVEDVEGVARLRTSNGGIRAGRIRGELDAQTSNGSVEVVDLDGNANLHTSNGHIRAEATHGRFEAATSNGGINVRLTDPGTSSPVRLDSSNGHIEVTLDATTLPDVRATTSNSSIVVRLPGSANARVRASTSHSNVTSEFDELRREGSRNHPELEGTLGSGGPLLELTTSNGSIKILKR